MIPGKKDKSLLLINSGHGTAEAVLLRDRDAAKQEDDDMSEVHKDRRYRECRLILQDTAHSLRCWEAFHSVIISKKQSLTWGWEFITQVLHMPTDKLWATVYEDDDQAYDIWKDIIGMPEERIVRLGKDDNFWEIGTGPCLARAPRYILTEARNTAAETLTASRVATVTDM